MKHQKLIIVLWLGILFVSCVSLDKVDLIHEYDPEFDFTSIELSGAVYSLADVFLSIIN